MLKKRLLILLALTLIVINLYSVLALSIDNKQDEYVSVMPNQKICIIRNITLDKDKSISYLMAISDKESVVFETASLTEIKVAKAEPKPIGEIGGGLKGNIITEITETPETPVIDLKPYNSESLTTTFKELSAVDEINTNIVELPATKQSQVEICYQMPNFETLKQEKSGELSLCVYQQNEKGDYFDDCEHSVWWNFDYGYRQKAVFFSNISLSNISTSVKIYYNDYMKADFSDIIWTSQNDSDNFSESEEAFYLQSKADEQYAIYQLNIFMDCNQNVSGICNQTHYFYYNANIDNSNKSCYDCICSWNTIHPYLLWHLNENIGTNVADSSGNNRNGTTINNPIWTNGKLNYALQFDSIYNQSISGGNVADFEINDKFSVEFWLNPNQIPFINNYDIITKLEPIMFEGQPTARGWIINTDTDENNNSHFIFVMINYVFDDTSNMLVEACDYNILSNSYQHIILTYNGKNDTDSVKCYVNGISRNVVNFQNNLSGTIKNNADLFVGFAFKDFPFNNYNGSIDEIVIYDTILSQSDVDFRYNEGLGTENPLTFCIPNSPFDINYSIFLPEPRPVYINCEYNENPYLEKKIDMFCTIINAQNDDFKCNSFVYFENNTLISASPQNQYIEGIGNINYFQAEPKLADTQIVNIELDTRDFTEQQLIAKIVCISNNNHKVTFTRFITPEYRELVQVGDITKHFKQNIGFYIGFFLIGLVLVFFIAMFMNWTGLEQYAKPFFIIALAVLLFIAIITYLIQST